MTKSWFKKKLELEGGVDIAAGLNTLSQPKPSSLRPNYIIWFLFILFNVVVIGVGVVVWYVARGIT